MYLEPFLHLYNWHRPHRGINGLSPVCRLEKDRYNLMNTRISPMFLDFFRKLYKPDNDT